MQKLTIQWGWAVTKMVNECHFWVIATDPPHWAGKKNNLRTNFLLGFEVIPEFNAINKVIAIHRKVVGNVTGGAFILSIDENAVRRVDHHIRYRDVDGNTCHGWHEHKYPEMGIHIPYPELNKIIENCIGVDDVSELHLKDWVFTHWNITDDLKG